MNYRPNIHLAIINLRIQETPFLGVHQSSSAVEGSEQIDKEDLDRLFTIATKAD